MADAQFLFCNAQALDLAQRLARRENRPIADIVESALELYASHQAKLEPAEAFYRRISAEAGSDFDLDETVRVVRVPQEGPEL